MWGREARDSGMQATTRAMNFDPLCGLGLDVRVFSLAFCIYIERVERGVSFIGVRRIGRERLLLLLSFPKRAQNTYRMTVWIGSLTPVSSHSQARRLGTLRDPTVPRCQTGPQTELARHYRIPVPTKVPTGAQLRPPFEAQAGRCTAVRLRSAEPPLAPAAPSNH